MKFSQQKSKKSLIRSQQKSKIRQKKKLVKKNDFLLEFSNFEKFRQTSCFDS
jgi:hypothetical protein